MTDMKRNCYSILFYYSIPRAMWLFYYWPITCYSHLPYSKLINGILMTLTDDDILWYSDCWSDDIVLFVWWWYHSAVTIGILFLESIHSSIIVIDDDLMFIVILMTSIHWWWCFITFLLFMMRVMKWKWHSILMPFWWLSARWLYNVCGSVFLSI